MAERVLAARKPLSRQNVGKMGGARAIRAQMEVSGIPTKTSRKLEDFATIHKRTSVTVRNQIIRYVSDFISEDIGLSRKISDKDTKLFTTPMSAPDGQIDIDEFEKKTGIRVSQTSVLKEGVQQRNVAYQEAKTTGLGDKSDISLGAIEISGDSAGFQRVLKERGQLKGIGGKKAYHLLTTAPELKNQWSRVRSQINEKFENVLIINVVDGQKGKRAELGFVKNALGDFDAFKSDSFLSNFSLNIKQRIKRNRSKTEFGPDGKGIILSEELTSFRIESKPTAALASRIKKAQQDITEKFIKSGTNAFSKAINLYLIKRIKMYENDPRNKGKVTPELVASLTGYAVALAREFEEGGQTPLDVSIRFKGQNNFNIKPGNIDVMNSTKKMQKAQKFISGAQITALVKRRLGQQMPKGPRRGPPLSANILTERTGRFRSSIQVIPDYRRSIMNFFYDPIYKTFIGTQRDPDKFVGRTIREVVQGLYSRAFAIARV